MGNYCYVFQLNEFDYDLRIGYSHILPPLLILPSLALFTNGALILSRYYKKKNLNEENASMEKMLHILTILELFMSIYWLVNPIVFQTVGNIMDKSYCSSALISSILSVFLQFFIWSFFVCTFHNLKTILLNPLEGVFRFQQRLTHYLLICFIFSAGIVLYVLLTKIYGISPLLSCFIRNRYKKDLNDFSFIFYIIFYLFPIVVIIYFLYISIILFKSREAKRKPHIKSLLIRYFSIGLIYSLFYSPMIILYFITFNKNITPSTPESWLSYFSYIFLISKDFVLCIFRILFGYVKLDCFKNPDKLNNIFEELIKDFKITDAKVISFKNLENEIIENFMRDILIGICHCLSINRNISFFDKKCTKKDCQYMQHYMIKKKHISFEDESVSKLDHLHIDFDTIAPQVFRKLMYMEGVTEDEIIDSLKPCKNTASINKSQGKSGNFFISTDDNSLILKTITDDELELITSLFLKKYYKFLKDNNDSLIVRIYGLFKINLDKKNVNVILMRNCVGKFKNVYYF